MSRILCFAGRHAARPSNLRAQGLYFSSCRRCGRSMVRFDKAWKAVPNGFRIVWRRGRRPGSAGEPGRNPPAPIAASPPRRAAAALPIRTRARRASPAFSVGALAGMGVRLLAWYCADSLRKWNRSRAARRLERRAVVLLLGR